MSKQLPTLTGCRAPHFVWKKASQHIEVYLKGKKNYSRLERTGHLVIRIGFKWRLLSKNNGLHWRLMTHETYNRECKI